MTAAIRARTACGIRFETHAHDAPPAVPTPRVRAVVNYRSYPTRTQPLTPAERLSVPAAALAIVLYAVALALPPVDGAAGAPPRLAARHLVYGLTCDGCAVGVPLLVAAGSALLLGRNRLALGLAVAATEIGLAAHLDAACGHTLALAGGFVAWQAAVVVIGGAAGLKWARFGAVDPAEPTAPQLGGSAGPEPDRRCWA